MSVLTYLSSLAPLRTHSPESPAKSRDHIDFAGLSGECVLRGANDER
jgi:hypothetical protein